MDPFRRQASQFFLQVPRTDSQEEAHKHPNARMCSISRDVTGKINMLVETRSRPNQYCIVPLLLYCMSDCTHDWRRLELVDKLFRDTIKTHMVQFQNYWIEVLVQRISFLELKVDD